MKLKLILIRLEDVDSISFGILQKQLKLVDYLAENQIRLVFSYVRMTQRQYRVRTGCKQIRESRTGVRCSHFNYLFFISLQLLRRLPAVLGRDRFLSWRILALNYHHVLALPFYSSYTLSLCTTLNLQGEAHCMSFPIFCVSTNSTEMFRQN